MRLRITAIGRSRVVFPHKRKDTEDSKMKSLQVLVLLFTVMIFSTLGYPQPTCVAPPLSEQQVKDIIDKERATRTDLPAPFPEYRWTVTKRGCYYGYFEHGIPEAIHYEQMFELNQYGVIVDVTVGGRGGKTPKMRCPDKVFSESELAEIIKEERVKRQDLPPPFPDYKTRVSRVRCLYFYYEEALPETRGNYQVFRIDPLGELMRFSRSQPELDR
jgi:hypothetical protein